MPHESRNEGIPANASAGIHLSKLGSVRSFLALLLSDAASETIALNDSNYSIVSTTPALLPALAFGEADSSSQTSSKTISQKFAWQANHNRASVLADVGAGVFQISGAASVVQGVASKAIRARVYRATRMESLAAMSRSRRFDATPFDAAALDRSIDNISDASSSVQMTQRRMRAAIELDFLAT